MLYFYVPPGRICNEPSFDFWLPLSAIYRVRTYPCPSTVQCQVSQPAEVFDRDHAVGQACWPWCRCRVHCPHIMKESCRVVDCACLKACLKVTFRFQAVVFKFWVRGEKKKKKKKKVPHASWTWSAVCAENRGKWTNEYWEIKSPANYFKHISLVGKHSCWLSCTQQSVPGVVWWHKAVPIYQVYCMEGGCVQLPCTRVEKWLKRMMYLIAMVNQVKGATIWQHFHSNSPQHAELWEALFHPKSRTSESSMTGDACHLSWTQMVYTGHRFP